MAVIRRFEDIQAWQKARILVREVYALTEGGLFGRDHALRDQVRRAAVSTMSNIAEGFARRRSKEFVNFLNMAHGSAAEVQSHCYVALDRGYISEEAFQKLYQLADEVSKIIQGLMSYLGFNSKLSTRNSQLRRVS